MWHEEIYAAWTAREGPWSDWVKPALFTQVQRAATSGATRDMSAAPPDVRWAPRSGDGIALVVDLPGPESVACGIALLSAGYQPVPLFNTLGATNAAIRVEEIVLSLVDAAAMVRQAASRFTHNTPPAFLLDSNRLSAPRPGPGAYDNRWMVFPQDFPSGNLLQAHGLREAMVVTRGTIDPDLDQVLRRWARTGLRLTRKSIAPDEPVQEHRTRSAFSPSWILPWLLVSLGLRQNAAGGFGGLVPVPTEGSGYA
ncbi:MAG: hypothetical protein KF699_00395 [Phycisphaeraceae bacterium]|nr:hypothetical protein [Phycisphaeraceae bacterium]